MSKVIAYDFDKESVAGKATFEGKKLEALNYGNSQRLRRDLTYVVPKQWVHAEKVIIDGEEKTSPKVFAIGYDDTDSPVVVTSVSINTLRARHLGKALDGAPTIKLVKKDGLLRAATQPQQYPVMVSGNLPIQVVGNEAKVARDFAFKVTDRYTVYNFKFKETSEGSGKWNILAKAGTDIADLEPRVVNEYSETDVVSSDTCPIPNFAEYACD